MMKIKLILAPLVFALTLTISAQIPILNSNPTISNKVIYLDFDGQKVTGTLWNNGATINALPSTVSAANMKLIWQRISEDYRPFNVNITTDSVRFNNATTNSRIRVVFTPTSAWYGSAGGVAYLGSFTWGGYPGTPCWIFENQLGYSSKNMAEAASHEAGHTLSLQHQSTYSSATCSKTAEYNPGVGTGVTSWAPIMGVGYSKNITLWHNGSNSTGCNTIQTDHSNSSPGITGNNFLSYLPDDVGDTYVAGKILNLNTITLADSGIITTPTDLDVYRFTICNNRYISVNVRPWALDSTVGSYQGANLDVKLKLYNSSGVLLAADTSITKLNSLVGLTLTAGSYFFSIDGGSSANYSDYGSLGKYYISVKATNPPQLTNTIVVPTNFCAGQNSTLSYVTNGSPNTWQWSITGPNSGTAIVANPSFNFSTAGIYTISLLATSSTSASCITTNTYNVGNIPTLSIIGTSTVLCPQKTGSLSVTGATSYTWLPGNFAGASLIVNPTVNTTYSVIGSNGTCSNSAASTLSISLPFTINLSASSSSICSGASVTLNASGANTYTFNPGFVTGNTAVFSPTYNTNYTVTATNNGCLKTAYILVNVSPHFYLNVLASDSIICPGQTVTFNLSGANSYTVNPGGLNGSNVTVNPLTTTIYTITGANNIPCLADTAITVLVDNCNLVDISKHELNNRFAIYPNPATTSFVIESDIDAFQITVLDVLGSEVYKGSSDRKQKLNINTESWKKGIYFIRLHKNLKTIDVKKLIIN
jgi:Secretion system C-terminal sorting domain/Metallo-peptidase family M12